MTQDFHINEMINSMAIKDDSVIVAAIKEKGFDPNDREFLTLHIQKIIPEGDPFEHYYYNYGQPDEIRIISFEKDFTFEQVTDEKTNSVTLKVSRKYY